MIKRIGKYDLSGFKQRNVMALLLQPILKKG
ncbi:hypothetical protein DP43_4832 [Burkholderia pseudomallei]|nr:hypothetical protein DP43_4832 [Burkholderia pseudomallei]